MNLLKSLSKISIPRLKDLTLINVPKDWEELKEFMKGSLKSFNSFYFNLDAEDKVESKNYLSSLKEAAAKTNVSFSVDYTVFTHKDFEELILSAKYNEKILLRDGILCLDEEWNFGDNMEGCKIRKLDLSDTIIKSKKTKNSYPESNSNLESSFELDSQPFEFLVKGISKCLPFSKSLKEIVIEDWNISVVEAQNILDKYNLDDIEIHS